MRAIAAALDALCQPPAALLRALAAEFGAASRFVQVEVVGRRMRADASLAAAAGREGREDLRRAAAAVDDFEAEIVAPFRRLLAGEAEAEVGAGAEAGAEAEAERAGPAAATLAPLREARPPDSLFAAVFGVALD